jgi:acyl-CoA synthetase (AMP-forming)/AMP-acid ligase II
VVLSHRALLVNAFMIGERTEMNSRDGGISWLPLFHDMGLIGALITSLHWRYPLVMMPTESFLMHPRRWLQWISKKRLTMSVAPNFAFQTAVERVPEKVLGDLDLSSWRLAFNGSEMVRSATLRSFSERFAPRGFKDSAHQPVYGMAENALAATFPSKDKLWSSLVIDRLSLEADNLARAPRDEHALRADFVSVGTPLAGVSVEIRSSDGHPLCEGQAGMIYIKSPSLMDGYFQQEQKTQAVLRDGWLQTGDIGFISDGELYITGRSKELIIKRGRNYYPDDIEMVASEAAGPKVLRVAVIGCENAAEGTEDIVLMLETHSLLAEERERIERDVNGALISALGIRADVTAFVPPRTITYTTSGKVQRAPLRERYLSGAISRG